MRKILFVYTAFAPENAVGSIRNTKLVKYLVRDGYEVTIISPELDSTTKSDSTLVSNELLQIQHVNVPYSKLFRRFFLSQRDTILRTNMQELRAKRSVMKGKTKAFLYRTAQEVYTIIRNNDWKNQVIKYLEANRDARNFYDYVVTGYPSLSSHLIGEYVLANNIAKKWVADFRDPIAYESLNSRIAFWRNKKLQKRLCSKANAVTCVTEEAMAKLAEGTVDRSKFFYLPNGFDEEDIRLIPEEKSISDKYADVMKIAYVGGLYGGKRDLSTLFELLTILMDDGSFDRNAIRFFYAGKEFGELNRQASKYGLQDILVDFGYVSRGQSLAIQQQSDLLLVSTWNTENDKGIVTGKIFECFMLKKPVLAIITGTEPNSELGSMAEKSGLGIALHTMTDMTVSRERALEFLSSLYRDKFDGKEHTMPVNERYISGFSYEEIANRFADILEAMSSDN